nr:hypothetical protein PBJLOJBB_PBJLOJBB_00064 [synthetic construct]
MPVSPAPTVPDFSVPLPVAPSGPSSPGGFWWKAHRGKGGGLVVCVRRNGPQEDRGVCTVVPVSNFLVSPVPHPSTHTFIRAVVGMSGWMEARDAVDHARQDLHHSKKGCLDWPSHLCRPRATATTAPDGLSSSPPLPLLLFPLRRVPPRFPDEVRDPPPKPSESTPHPHALPGVAPFPPRQRRNRVQAVGAKIGLGERLEPVFSTLLEPYPLCLDFPARDTGGSGHAAVAMVATAVAGRDRGDVEGCQAPAALPRISSLSHTHTTRGWRGCGGRGLPALVGAI